MVVFFLMLASGTLLILLLALAIGWQKERERAIRAEMASMRMPSDAGERFSRIEQALEAIAVEVERLSESQRFSARILAEAQPKLLSPEASTHDAQSE